MSIKAHIVSGATSVALAVSFMAAWQHYHSSPTLARVDIYGIVTAQKKSLEAQLKPGMDQKAQAAIIDSASRFGKQLDFALTQVSADCKCTLINAAAIVKDSPVNHIVDYTQRVNDLVAGKK